MTELDLPLRDGRTLHVYDDGDGLAVVWHHGTPACGLPYAPHVADAHAQGIRLIGYDRAGYGGSTPAPGRSVADVAADVEDVLDALGVDRFATWGISGGGPHTLACAALLPDRCVAVASLASPAPFEAAGLDWLDGQGEQNHAEWAAALAGEEELERHLQHDLASMAAATPEQLADVLATLLSPPDREVMTGDVARYFDAATERALAPGVAGWRDDDLAFTRPWGFVPEQIRVPALLWQGVQDLMVPPAHGRWLAARIPGVETHLSAEDGHITLSERRVPEVHRWLLAHA